MSGHSAFYVSVTCGRVVELTVLFGQAQAAHQFLQGQRLVVADVTVLHELLHALLRLGLLPQEALERLDLFLPDVPAGVLVQLAEVPVDHPLLQGVTGVRLHDPKGQGDQIILLHDFPLTNTTPYLPADAGSVTACTMSVDSASRTLVRNSVFFAPGQPGK